MNFYYLAGVLLYSHYVIGVIFANASGLTALPIITLLAALVYSLRDTAIHRETLVYASAVLITYTIYFGFSDWTEYAMFKYGMFMSKAIPLLVLGSFVAQRREQYFKGICSSLLVFLFICLLYIGFANVSVGVNDRLELGVFNPIWISRALFELVLIVIIVIKPRVQFTAAIFVASIAVAYYAGSKGPILAFLIAYFLWFRSERKAKGAGIGNWFLYAGILAVPLIIYVVADPTSYIFQRFFLPVPDGTSAELVEESRSVVWPMTVSLFVSQDTIPLLFGNGIGAFPAFYFGNGTGFRYYPHNIFLELLVEHGAVLTMAVSFLVIQKIKITKSKFKYILIYFIINAMFSGDLVLNEYIFFYLGLVIADGGFYGRKVPVAEDAGVLT